MNAPLLRIQFHHLDGARAGQVDAFSQPVIVVGRAPDCHLVFANERGVSGKHAEVRLIDGRFELVDTNSTNGTFVGDDRISTRTLKNGDVVRFGFMGPQIRVEFEEARPAPPPAAVAIDSGGTMMMAAPRPVPPPAAAPPVPAAAPAMAAPAARPAAPPPVVATTAPPPPRRPVLGAQAAATGRAAAGGPSAQRWLIVIGATVGIGMLAGLFAWLLAR